MNKNFFCNNNLRWVAIAIALATAIASSSCSPEDVGPDDRLSGSSWGDLNATWNFVDDEHYYQQFTRALGTAQVSGEDEYRDSIFGTYSVDTRRETITFKAEGYKLYHLSSGQVTGSEVVMEDVDADVWNYEIEGDSLLRYESNTAMGTLKLR
jgi:hypothetical protein